MKIVWLSANKLGYELLKEVLSLKSKDFQIQAIITLSQKSKTIMYDGIDSNLWKELGIKVIEVDRLNEEIELVNELSPDIIVMCGWRQIVDESIFSIPKYFVGFHPTLLPKGRGPAPIINSILHNYKESGLTMFHVSQGIDDGDIIGQEKFKIEEHDHASDVYEKVIIAGKKLVSKYIHLLVQNKAPRIKQDESKATIFPKLSLENNEIDINSDSLEDMDRKIRALSKPYKGAFIKKGNKKLIIWKSEIKDA